MPNPLTPKKTSGTPRPLRPPAGRGRVRIGLEILTGIALVGTLWYWLIEGFSFVNALYQTVFTISTVGIGEAEPLGARGRIFTTVLIVVGVGVALYTLAGLVEDLVENQLGRIGRWRMQHKIETLCGHVVLCGFGRVGHAALELLGGKTRLVVVDRDRDACAEAAEMADVLTVVGDSTDDKTLIDAGIAGAATLIVSLQSDADAISTVLSARALNADLRIVARANAWSSEAKLVRAGVDHVVNPLQLGAQRLTTFALQPAVADFMDIEGAGGHVELRIEELIVPEGSALDGTSIGEARIRESTGAVLLAVVRRPGSGFEHTPGPDTRLSAGMTLIVIGTNDQLKALGDLL